MHDIGPDARAALLALVHAATAVQAHAEAKLAAIGLSLPKFAALSALREAGGSIPLGQLADRLSCVKSNITQLVDRLEADGLVARAPDPVDRRSRLAALTPAGLAACEEGSRIQAQTERTLLAEFEAGEARQLTALVEKLERRAAG